MTTVLIDIDNTIAQTQHAYIAHANASGPRHFTFEKITKEYSDDPNDEFELLVRSFIESDDYMTTVRAILPYARVGEALKALKDATYEVVVASSRAENWHAPTVQWLEDHGFRQYVDHIFLRTEDINSADFKMAVAKIIDPTAAFDDSYETARLLASISRLYLIDQP